MRKVFALLAGLALLGMLAACSDNSTPTPPTHHAALAITTSTVPVGYTCNPYTQTLGASGGTKPYTWSLAATSDPLPQGLTLDAATGKLSGVVLSPGDFTFTVRCTDSSPTPKWVEKAFTVNVSVPSNPSLAVYYDNSATVCTSNVAAFDYLDCYVFVMIEGSDIPCTQACEFKLRLTDENNADLLYGRDYQVYGDTNFPQDALVIGQEGAPNPFSGVAVSFTAPKYGAQPLQVASFKMFLSEDFSNLSFKFEANPSGILGLATCQDGNPEVTATGRVTALNFQ